MCLVDDLMEPFRPLVDYTVVRLGIQGYAEDTPTTRRALSEVLTIDLGAQRGATPLVTCIKRAARFLAQSDQESEPSLVFPATLLIDALQAVSCGTRRALRLSINVDAGHVRPASHDKAGAPRRRQLPHVSSTKASRCTNFPSTCASASARSNRGSLPTGTSAACPPPATCKSFTSPTNSTETSSASTERAVVAPTKKPQQFTPF